MMKKLLKYLGHLLNRIFPVGTRSVLFGVHAFWWHPITVLLGWYRCYHSVPTWRVVVAAFLHDSGYWNCGNLDGEEGQSHPARSAALAKWLGFGPEVQHLCLTHSRHYAAKAGLLPGPLFMPDKVSIFFDPEWFYLFRAGLSGELKEFVNNAPSFVGVRGSVEWLRWYKVKIWKLEEKHKYEKNNTATT